MLTKNRRNELINEIRFQTARSSGSGGQNVNKVESKVEARLSVSASQVLTDAEKLRLQQSLASKLTSEGELVVTSQVSRSQHKNKELATEKLLTMVSNGLQQRKARRHTTPTPQAIEKRLKHKKMLAEKKIGRSKIDY